jgi:two-component system LytT family response regulator
LRCLVVDDEPLAREGLEAFVRRLPSLEWSGSVDSAVAALDHLRGHAVDLVFLDVRLGGWSGVELLETGAVPAQVIFTTAYPDHAARAYDLKAADYLLKPYTFERFVQAVERARQALANSATATSPAVLPAALPDGADEPRRRFLFVKTESRLERVALSQILYIEGRGDYRRIRTATKAILTLETFGDLERRLPADLICRVHKSFMVALDKIESVERDRIRIGDKLIPVSDSYREAFYRLIDPRP